MSIIKTFGEKCFHTMHPSKPKPHLPPKEDDLCVPMSLRKPNAAPTGRKPFPHVTELLLLGLSDTRTAQISGDPNSRPSAPVTEERCCFQPPNHILIELEVGVCHLQAKHRGSESGLGIRTG